jgi:exopolysaccharide production protein ExoZ
MPQRKKKSHQSRAVPSLRPNLQNSLPAAASSTISGIQLLRVLAATAVVVTHVEFDFVHHLGLPNVLPQWFGLLGAGVHLFFVISGFIMVYSSELLFGRRMAPSEFLRRRIARIVPLYWAVTTVMLGYDLARGFAAADASGGLVLSSYFFVPYPRPSGEMGPLYGVGWTLNYEMFFYVVFAVALVASRPLAICGIIGLFALFGLVHALSNSLPLPFGFWFNPIILEFCLGMLLGWAYHAKLRLPAWLRPLLLGAAAVGFSWQASLWHPRLPEWLGLGLPSVLAVAAVALTERPFALPVINRLGDASYAIYLVHPMIIAVARMLAEHNYLRPAAIPWPYLAGTIIASIGAAVLVHDWFEKPLTNYCRRLLFSGPAAPAMRQI